ncbi:COG1470 family protein [Candidatus Pyrohabitans sp.]
MTTHKIKRFTILLIACLALFSPAFALSAEYEKTYKIEEGHVKFGSYTLEFFTFDDKKIKCFNALNGNLIVYQFCDDIVAGKRELRENMGKVYRLSDFLAFTIAHYPREYAEVRILSAQKIKPEVVSSKWFSAYLELTSSSPRSKVVAYPGDVIKASVTLKNNAPEEKRYKKTYRLYVVRPFGWDASLKVGGNRVSSIALAPGEEVTINAEITVPEDFSGDYVISIVAEGGYKGTVEKVRYDIPVIRGQSTFSSKLHSSIPEISAHAGEKVELNLELENADYADRYFNLTALAPRNWNVSFYYSGLKANLIQVAGKSRVSLKAEVEMPGEAKPSKYSITFRALNEKSVAEHEVSIVVEPSPVTSKLRTSTPEIIVKPGDEVRLSLELENSGNSEDYYLLSAVAPPEWEVAFYHKNFKVPSVKLAAESSVSLEAAVKIPKETTLGDYQLSFIAKGDNSRAMSNVTVHVEGSYALAVELSKLYTRITAGEAEKIIARVANTGKNTLTGIELSLEIPEGWSYEIVPESVKKLQPGKAADFSVTILPPADAGIGDYFLKLRAKAEQTKAEDVSLRITVQQKSSYGYAGIAVAILSVIMLLAIYRKFGRR